MVWSRTFPCWCILEGFGYLILILDQSVDLEIQPSVVPGVLHHDHAYLFTLSQTTPFTTLHPNPSTLQHPNYSLI